MPLYKRNIAGWVSGFMFSVATVGIVTPASWASGNERINVKAIGASEVTDRLSRTQELASASSGPKVGLSALKELLFDEMAIFTIVSALVLLVALIGAAVIISKRQS